MSAPQKLLDRPALEVFDDHPQLDRLVRVVAGQRELGYVAALDQLHKALEFVDVRAPLRKVLEMVPGVTPERVADDVKVLDRRDAAVTRTLDSELAPFRLERTNALGQVLLEQQNGSPNIGKLLADPVETENRYQRARRARPGAYDGEDGRRVFEAEDRAGAEAGLDLVRTLERAGQIQAAQAKAGAVAQRLDGAIRGGKDPGERLRLLDTELVQLGLAEPVPGLRLLESERTDVSREALELDARVRDRLRLLGKGMNEYMLILDQVMEEDA